MAFIMALALTLLLIFALMYYVGIIFQKTKGALPEEAGSGLMPLISFLNRPSDAAVARSDCRGFRR